jgi:hypothetical protein
MKERIVIYPCILAENENIDKEEENSMLEI